MAAGNSGDKVVKKHKGGRPSVYSAEHVSLLKAAFANAFTVDQACAYAEISKETYYNWLEKRPELVDQMERARHQVGFKAKQVVVGAVNKGDVETAKWWLKNKHSDEFGGAPSTNINLNFGQMANDQRDKYGI